MMIGFGELNTERDRAWGNQPWNDWSSDDSSQGEKIEIKVVRFYTATFCFYLIHSLLLIKIIVNDIFNKSKKHFNIFL